MTKRDKPLVRPLSPFMHYRKWHMMVLSMLHRVTGGALTVGALLLVYWLAAAAMGPDVYAKAQAFFSCVWVKLVLVGFVFSFCYHFMNGIRHLVWDTGRGFDLHVARNSGVFVLVGAVVMTVIVCAIFMARTGGAA